MKLNSTNYGFFKPISWLVMIIAFVCITGVSYSQVAINNDNSAPDASAMLDVKATGMGLLAPRMTFAQRPAAPATGLLIYQTDNSPGYYYFDGAAWQKVGSTSNHYWGLIGSDITNTNAGNVYLGIATSSEGHALNALHYSGTTSAAVRGVEQESIYMYSAGSLGQLNWPGNPLGLPVDVANIGVFGFKPASGVEGTGIYGWTIDNDVQNYGGIFVADGSHLNTNNAIYAEADSGSVNYAGYFKGRVHVEGNNANDGAADSTQYLLVSEVTHSSFYDTRALQGISTPQDGYGIAIEGLGGYMGVYGQNNGGAYGGSGWGVYGYSSGSAGTRYGVYGYASNTGSSAIGIYGSASGATANWGGYFDGRVYASDNVGIGTLTPVAKLHVKGDVTVLQLEGNTNPLVTFYDDAGTYKAWFQAFGNDFYVANRMNGYLRFRTNNLDRMSIDPSGNVLIGSIAATGYRLAVDGNIICEELRVEDSGSWPDYVFDKDYNLMSLEELEQSIEENKHLPGLPPAAQVEEEGFLVADMQKRVLEKVEELTLYTIEQGKLIQELQNEVKALKAENTSLVK